jgi:hypothetical protein
MGRTLTRYTFTSPPAMWSRPQRKIRQASFPKREPIGPTFISRDTYGIGPQETIAWYLKFSNYTSAQTAPSPNVPNLGFMYHCHYLTHHDMSMMGSYFVFGDRAAYF